MDTLKQIGLETFEGAWYWRGRFYSKTWADINDATPAGRLIIDAIHSAPEFQEFCKTNGIFALGFTKIKQIELTPGTIKLTFMSGLVEQIRLYVKLDAVDASLAKFINNNPLYVTMAAISAEYNTAREKISALEAEIAELRLRPGGPDYLAAKARFESGYAN